MPKAPDENRAIAEELFKEGMALVEIAKKLGISLNTVKSWRARYWKDILPNKKLATKNKGSCKVATEKEKPKKRRKQGAQPGNKNALKHGGYSKIAWDTLDAEELEMAMDMPEDAELLLIDQIRLFTVRERRIMKAINWYRDQSERLSISSVQQQEEKRSFKTQEDRELYEERIAEKVENGERLPGNRYNVITNTESKDSAIARLEKELSVVQGKKTQAIQTLAELRLEKEKLAGDAQKDDIVQAWITGLMGGD